MKHKAWLSILLLAPTGLWARADAPAVAAAGATTSAHAAPEPKAAKAAKASTAAAPAAAAAAAAEGIGALVAEAGQIGKEARLPPHIVEALGLGAHVGGLAVRQLALRQGVEVHAFNVSAENSRDVVMFEHNEASKDTVVFLLTPAAKLRRAVSYSAGGESHVLAAPEARRRFAPELDYWLASRRSGGPADGRPRSPRPGLANTTIQPRIDANPTPMLNMLS